MAESGQTGETNRPSQVSRLRFERVATPRPAVAIGVPLLAALLALVAGAIIFVAAGQNPPDVYRAMFSGAFGDQNGLSETLVKTCPLLLTGLGIAVAFKMQLWNIGAEGQFYFGALGATWIALFALPNAPAIIVIPAMIVAGLIGGAIWGAIPGILRAYLGANEIITSLMLNYVAILYADSLVHGAWRNPSGFGFPGTKQFPEAAWLPTWGTTPVHLGLVFGIVAALAL